MKSKGKREAGEPFAEEVIVELTFSQTEGEQALVVCSRQSSFPCIPVREGSEQ